MTINTKLDDHNLRLPRRPGTPEVVGAHTNQPMTQLQKFSSGLPQGRTLLLLRPTTRTNPAAPPQIHKPAHQGRGKR
jgi:hypothetical protein